MDTYYQYSRPELHPLIPTDAKRILDIGCAAGALGRAIKERQACHVTGIEMVEAAARQAKERLDEVHIGDAIALMGGMPENAFDCIVFADVLEHMEHPEQCLAQARRILTKNGRIVVSLPNVRHWSVVKNLLEGHWNYEDAGILDRTHLRFFTRESMIRLFVEAGFRVESLTGTVLKGWEVPTGIVQSLNAHGLDTSSLEQEGRIYQFIVSASPATAAKDDPATEPSISVILPTRNRPDLLRDALGCLKAQYLKEFEVLVINDGETPIDDVLEEFPELEIRSLKTPAPAQGAAAARNLGLRSALGRYVAFLDDDDRYYPMHLERLLKGAETHGSMVLYGDTYEATQQLVDGKMKVVSRKRRLAQDLDQEQFLVRDCVPLISGLFRREALEACGPFDESLPDLEGWDLWIRLSQRYAFHHLEGITAEYRVPAEDPPEAAARRLQAQRRLYEKHAELRRQKPWLPVLQASALRQAETALANKTYDLGIVLVVRDAAQPLLECLSPLVEAIPEQVTSQLLIVDDGSRDGTTAMLAELDGDVLIQRNSAPLGWARSCNEAIAQLRSPLALVLEPDTRLAPETLTALLAAMSDPAVGAAGMSPLPLEARGGSIPSLDQGCLLVRQADFLEVGGFDEQYAEGWQDDDLARKLHELGRAIATVEAHAYLNHEKASARRHHQNDRDRFAVKWAPGPDDAPTTSAPTSEPPKFSLVALTYNQLDYTKRFVESVFAHSTAPFELIMVDNASKDGTPTYLQELASTHPNVRLILNDQNQGFAGGCNQGIAIARGEVIVLINNDTIVTERWLERFLWSLEADPLVGMVGPRSNYVAGPQLLPNVSYEEDDVDGIQAFAKQVAIRNRREGFYASRAIGFCVAIKREVLEKIGGLDTRFGTGNLEDDDLSIRTLIAGYRIWIANDIFIHHFGSKTFDGEKIDYTALVLKNWEIFKAKWDLPNDRAIDGYYLPKELLTHPRAASLMVFPILCKQVPPLAIEGARNTNFLVMPDWQRDIPSLARLLKTYAGAFGPQDDVALLLWHDPSDGTELETVGAQLQALLDSEGLDPEVMADMVLHSEHPGPLAIAGVYRAAQAFLALEAGRGVEEATACGIPCLDNPGMAALQELAKTPAPH